MRKGISGKQRLPFTKSASHKLLNLKAQHNPLHMVQEPRSDIVSSEVRDLQKHYFSAMLNTYHSSQQSLPDPIKILELIKEKDRSLKQYQSQKQSIKHNERIQQSLVELLREKQKKAELFNHSSFFEEKQNEWDDLRVKLKTKLPNLLEQIGVNPQSLEKLQSASEHEVFDKFVSQFRVFLEKINQEKRQFKEFIEDVKKREEVTNIQMMSLKKDLTQRANKEGSHEQKLRKSFFIISSLENQIGGKDIKIRELQNILYEAQKTINQKEALINTLKSSIQQVQKMIETESKISEALDSQSPNSPPGQWPLFQEVQPKFPFRSFKSVPELNQTEQINKTNWKQIMDKTINLYEEKILNKDRQILKQQKKIEKYKKKLNKVHHFISENIEQCQRKNG